MVLKWRSSVLLCLVLQVDRPDIQCPELWRRCGAQHEHNLSSSLDLGHAFIFWGFIYYVPELKRFYFNVLFKNQIPLQILKIKFSFSTSRLLPQTITAPTDTSAHQLRTAGFKFPPDYNRLHQVCLSFLLWTTVTGNILTFLMAAFFLFPGCVGSVTSPAHICPSTSCQSCYNGLNFLFYCFYTFLYCNLLYWFVWLLWIWFTRNFKNLYIS